MAPPSSQFWDDMDEEVMPVCIEQGCHREAAPGQ